MGGEGRRSLARGTRRGKLADHASAALPDSAIYHERA